MALKRRRSMRGAGMLLIVRRSPRDCYFNHVRRSEQIQHY